MTPEELRAIMAYLRERVRLNPQEPEGPVVIAFHDPTEQAMIEARLNPEVVKRILRVPWWEEMKADIVETPEMCDPEDPPHQVLEYARDVVSEYIRKRFPFNSE
jgi:hypothetical protein